VSVVQLPKTGIAAHAAASVINGIMMSQVISVQALGNGSLASRFDCMDRIEEWRKPARRTR
jgi:hypothetical protein